MKKIICLLLTATFLSGMLVHAEPIESYVFNESFCGLVTNSNDTGKVSATADDLRIINTNENDKALRMEIKRRHNMSAVAQMDGLDKVFVFSLDMEAGGCVDNGQLIFYDGGGASVGLVNFSKDNTITLCDGKRIPGTYLNKMTGIDVVIETASSACSVYLNGKCVVYRWYVSSMPKDIKKAEVKFFSTKEGNAYCVIDGIWAYNKNTPVSHKQLPKENFNKTEVEFDSSIDDAEEVGDKVYISRTFDETNSDPFSGMLSQPDTNTIETVKEKLNSNTYLRLVKNYTGSGILDVRNSFSQRFVIEVDMSMGESLLSGSLYVRGSPDSLYLLRFNPDGTVTLDNGDVVCKLQKGKWTRCAVAVDMSTSLIDVYLDGKLLYEEVELPVFIPPSTIIRFYIGAGNSGSGGELRIDNIKVYDGIKPNESSNEEKQDTPVSNVVMNDAETLLSSEEEEEKLLKGHTAISADGAYIFCNNEKIKTENRAYRESDDIMVPLRTVASAFGYETIYNADTKEITVSNVKIIGGNIYHNGEIVESDKPPVIKNGVTYISAKDFGRYIAGKKTDIYAHGTAVFSDNGTSFTKEEEKKIFLYLFHERPDAEQILNDFNSNSEGVHPRVIVNKEQVERLKRLKNNKDKYALWSYEAVIEEADRYMKMKPAELSDYSGISSNIYLSAARSVRDRFYYMGYAYLLTGNKEYADPVWEQIKVASEFPEWGETITFLAVGEMLGAFGVAYDWMYDCWSDEQKKFIEDTMMKKGMQYSYMAYRGTLPPGNSSNRSWYKWENNWNQVCNGGTVMAACALFDVYPKECSLIISNAIRSNENALEAFYPYGSYAEGMGYHSYALRYLTPMYQTLKVALGTDYGMLKAPGLSNTFNYVFDLCGPSTITNNYHDADEGSFNSAYLWWFADWYDNKNYYDERVYQMEEHVSIPSIYDALFYNPEHSYTDSQDTTRSLEAYYSQEELVSMRSAWKDEYATWISYHGGSNIMSMHGHIDTGSFILEMLGERWSKDLGPDTYSSTYWSETGRPTYYRIRAEGHNTLVLNPDYTGGQTLGEEGFSPVVRLESKPKGAISVLDMTNAYTDNASSAKRGFMLCDDRRNVLMRDELQLLGETQVYWFMHTDADIEIIDANTAILTKNGMRLKCVMTSNLASAAFSVLDATPLNTSPSNSSNSENKGIKRLTINGNGKGYAYIQVKFMDEDAPEANKPLPTLGINEWTIPDGELTQLPTLENIIFNSKEIEGFNSRIKKYSVYIPEGVEISDYKIETVSASGIQSDISYTDKGAVIRAYRPENPELATTYTVDYIVLLKRADIDGYVQCQLSDVKGSVEQEGHGVFSAVDGDTTTRWAANGKQWMIIELKDETQIDAVALYMMDSKVRTSNVKIEVSSDMQTWENVFDGVIGGKRDGYDIINTEGKTAKYVKLTANGNSVNSWNSVLEFTALKKK